MRGALLCRNPFGSLSLSEEIQWLLTFSHFITNKTKGSVSQTNEQIEMGRESPHIRNNHFKKCVGTQSHHHKDECIEFPVCNEMKQPMSFFVNFQIQFFFKSGRNGNGNVRYMARGHNSKSTILINMAQMYSSTTTFESNLKGVNYSRLKSLAGHCALVCLRNMRHMNPFPCVARNSSE